MTTGWTESENGRISPPADTLLRLGFSPETSFTLHDVAEGLLLRPVDPPLTRVYVEPTSACNLSCRTCIRNSWSEATGTMSMETYRRLIEGLREVPSLRKVSFWGFGEPLLHPHIVEMVALAKGIGAQTQIVTNALLLDEEKAEGLVAAGLDSLVVSVDGASAKVHADVHTGADLETVHRNLMVLRIARVRARHDLEIGIEFVMMRRNVAELPALPDLALSMGASFIVLTHLLPYTEELKDEILYGMDAGTCYFDHRSKWAPEVIMPRMDWRRELHEPLAKLFMRTKDNGIPRERRKGVSGYCRFVGEGSLAVAWDGQASPCVALMHSYSCFVHRRPKSIRRYRLGDIAQESPSEIWGKEEYRRFRQRVDEFDFPPCTDCGGCQLAESNEEDCIGSPFPTCGDCLWAKGVIQCP